ncbi:MAG: hypothetical protein H7A21_14275 [Spirochaetales bacterium]|nr:hypothetical protein [Leptospiraceae bacterium]MCP5482598.1 hypothetical protein [Spirochaetales bacterium]MCP5485187.1 hypothetical protein [Spirochaetales bacterium]
MKRALAGLGLLLVLGACDATGALVEEAEELRAGGHFEAALATYHQALHEDPTDGRVLAGMGGLLTLRRVSLYAGLDQMQAALNARKDPVLREQLILLYLAMGRFESAEQLLSEPQLTMQELFEPKIVLLRTGLRCLETPSAPNLSRLEALPGSPRRDYFRVLCRFAARNAGTLPPEPLDLSQIESEEIRCEAGVLLPDDELEPGFRRACRARFPGSIAIHRERPPVSRTGLAVRELFSVDVYEPADPGRPDIPIWVPNWEEEGPGTPIPMEP